MILILAIFVLWAYSFLGRGVSHPLIYLVLALGTIALIVQVRGDTAAD
jgi:hypothetical protein